MNPQFLDLRPGNRCRRIALALSCTLCFTLTQYAHANAAVDGCQAGINAGAMAVDESFDVSEGDVDLLFDPPDSGTALGVSFGCMVAERWLLTGEYQYGDLDEIRLDNWLASISYTWNLGEDKLVYAGAVAGWSVLEWDEDPVNTLEQDRESEQAAWGAQAGFLLPLGDRWRLNFRYLFLSADHKTRLEPLSGRATYEHEYQQFLSLGVEWQF